MELVEKNPQISQAEASRLLYGDPASKAFLMLKGRLIDKLYEGLSLSVSLQNHPALKDDPQGFAPVKLQKQLLYAQILIKRGLENLAFELLEKVNEQARQLHLPEFRLQALIYLRSLAAAHHESVATYHQEIEEVMAAYEVDIKGVGLLDDFNVLTRKQSVYDRAIIDWLEGHTQYFKEELERAYSARAHYYFLTLLTALDEGREDYGSGKKHLQELIELISRETGLKSNNRLGAPYLRLAAIELMAGHYEAGREAALEALAIFPTHKFNHLSAAIYACFGHIYTDQLDAAKALLGTLGWFAQRKRRNTSMEVTRYLSSCVAFCQGDLRAAVHLLGNVNEILADKSGWNTSLRIHEILLYLEQEKIDLAAARIEALRKHIARYGASDRDQVIFRILYLLEKRSFYYQFLNDEMEALMEDLTHKYPWSPISQEVIRFDIWLKAHQMEVPFYPLLLAELP